MGNFIDLSKEIECVETFDEDFSQFPPNTRLFKVYMPEATNVKFYRNHQNSNRLKVTFISINEEMKRKHNTIGLYFYDFSLKEGSINSPFVHGSFEKRDEQYREYFIFGFTHNLSENKLTNLLKFPNEIIEEDLEEYIAGQARNYEIKCHDGSIFVGEYVVPTKCAYFRLHSKRSPPEERHIFRNFSSFPERTVRLYTDGLHCIPLELSCNQAVQLLDFLVHDGKAEVYALHKSLAKSCCGIILSRFEKLSSVRQFDLLITLAPFYRESLPDVCHVVDEIMAKIDKAKFHQSLGEMMVQTKTFSLIKSPFEFLDDDDFTCGLQTRMILNEQPESDEEALIIKTLFDLTLRVESMYEK